MTNSDIANKLFAALDAKKWDEAAGYLTKDFKFTGPMPNPLNKDEFIAFQRAIHTGLPDFNHNASVASESKEGEIRGTVKVTGNHRGVLEMPMIPKIEATNKRVELPKEKWTIQAADGKIKSLHVDVPPDGGFLNLLRQIGRDDVADCLRAGNRDCRTIEAGAGAAAYPH